MKRQKLYMTNTWKLTTFYEPSKIPEVFNTLFRETSFRAETDNVLQIPEYLRPKANYQDRFREVPSDRTVCFHSETFRYWPDIVQLSRTPALTLTRKAIDVLDTLEKGYSSPRISLPTKHADTQEKGDDLFFVAPRFSLGLHEQDKKLADFPDCPFRYQTFKFYGKLWSEPEALDIVSKIPFFGVLGNAILSDEFVESMRKAGCSGVDYDTYDPFDENENFVARTLLQIAALAPGLEV